MGISRIIVLEGQIPWVQSLMHAVANTGVEVIALKPRSVGRIIRRPRRPRVAGRFTQKKEPYVEQVVIVPGLKRFPRLSRAILARKVRRLVRGDGRNDAVVYTLPIYAGIAEAIRGPLCVYDAHDAFQFYTNWNPQATKRLEKRMLKRADLVLSVAEALSEDFRKITRAPIVMCRTAASREFIEQMAEPMPLPADLAAVPRPIVGITGFINSTYDWDLIAALAQTLPEVSFVFVGSVRGEPCDLRTKMESALAMPNVWSLGAKPHEDLPAYLKGFDVCLNPLAVDEHGDRRCPLRLYDYLSTDKPVLSTGIREAFSHEGLVATFKSADEAGALIRCMVRREYPLDIRARSEYIRNNTWESRASFVREKLDECNFAPAK
jgi:glycosyltransferase involved in cell wall biosynthesis